MPHDLAPLFLFSLPRSGSTLSQRILGSDPRIATTSEPWILLPMLYALRREGVYTEYWHHSAVMALEDFCEALPNGRETYREEIRALALRLYGQAAAGHGRPDACYFLDKSPRYALIADEVIRTFPDGKFLFLWRNPLAMIASIIETWGAGRWFVFLNHVDVYLGLERLLVAYEANRERSWAFRYEDALTDPIAVWRGVFSYLELPFQPCILDRFPQTILTGRMGDPTRSHYDHLSAEPLDKWKTTLANPVRKLWCARYLRWIGQERLSLMGYDLPTLLADLRALPNRPRRVASDLFWIAAGAAYETLEMTQVRPRVRNLWNRGRVYGHR